MRAKCIPGRGGDVWARRHVAFSNPHRDGHLSLREGKQSVVLRAQCAGVGGCSCEILGVNQGQRERIYSSSLVTIEVNPVSIDRVRGGDLIDHSMKKGWWVGNGVPCGWTECVGCNDDEIVLRCKTLPTVRNAPAVPRATMQEHYEGQSLLQVRGETIVGPRLAAEIKAEFGHLLLCLRRGRKQRSTNHKNNGTGASQKYLQATV